MEEEVTQLSQTQKFLAQTLAMSRNSFSKKKGSVQLQNSKKNDEKYQKLAGCTPWEITDDSPTYRSRNRYQVTHRRLCSQIRMATSSNSIQTQNQQLKKTETYGKNKKLQKSQNLSNKSTEKSRLTQNKKFSTDTQPSLESSQLEKLNNIEICYMKGIGDRFLVNRKMMKGKTRRERKRQYTAVGNIFQRKKKEGRQVTVVDLNNPNKQNIKYLQCRSIFLTNKQQTKTSTSKTPKIHQKNSLQRWSIDSYLKKHEFFQKNLLKIKQYKHSKEQSLKNRLPCNQLQHRKVINQQQKKSSF